MRALEGLVCDSPLGDGHVRLTGDLPDKAGFPHFSVELDRIPVAAGLDALRTVRNGIGPNLEVAGTASGKIVYAESAAASPATTKPVKAGKAAKGLSEAGPLTGSFTVDGFQLTGGGLSRPVTAPKLVLTPAPEPQGRAQALTGTVAVPLGGTAPLTREYAPRSEGLPGGVARPSRDCTEPGACEGDWAWPGCRARLAGRWSP